MKQFLSKLWLSIYLYISSITKTFNRKQWIVFYVGLFITVIGLLSIIYKINQSILVSVPRFGGTFTEGIIGTPRFINPVLAINNADKDLTKLVYSGLMKHAENGELVVNIAESFTVTNDQKTYTFKLKDNIYFHNNTKVTADDVVYTIETIQNPLIKSPLKTSWEGVEVKKIDDETIVFNLKQSYISFLENTTVGILPSKKWNSLTPEQFSLSDLNTKPIGTGPYKIDTIIKNNSGIPTSYTLVSNNRYIDGSPFIENLEFIFYGNEKEMVNGFKGNEVDAVSQVSPTTLKELSSNKNYILKTKTLPRMFSIFLNQNKAQIFTNLKIRKAINIGINRQEIIDKVLNGYGEESFGPLPRWMNTLNKSTETNVDLAKQYIEKEGYVLGTDGIYEKKQKKGPTSRLSFTLATANTLELKKAAENISSQLKNIGIEMKIEIFESGTLNQEIIRNRSYEALLFGQNIEIEAELFAFWHSSQRNDPGLNIGLYANPEIDKLLEKIHKTEKIEDRTILYEKIENIIKDDVGAVFLYSPKFTYLLSKVPSGLSLDHFISTEDRFENINKWFINTDQIWKWFAK